MAENETNTAAVLVSIVDMFETSLKELLKDQGFQIPSALAKEALLAASEMLEWIADDREAALSFLSPLVSALELCVRGKRLEKKAEKEKMWGKFHFTRTSKEFLSYWSALMKASLVKETAPPLFYQHITDILFKRLIKLYTPVSSQTRQSRPPSLNYEEENALYYTAGYVVRETKKKLSKRPYGAEWALAKEINLCLVELSEEFEESDEASASDWTGQINRGGLFFVNSQTYQFFYALEMRFRQETQQSTPSISPGFKEEVTKKLCQDDDVVFQWSIVAADWDNKAAEVLLGMMVELWVTVRGFAFARHWLEGYKQRQKKSTQKSKGVRKQLIGKGSTSSGQE